jgi:hypothetical protein
MNPRVPGFRPNFLSDGFFSVTWLEQVPALLRLDIDNILHPYLGMKHGKNTEECVKLIVEQELKQRAREGQLWFDHFKGTWRYLL